MRWARGFGIVSLCLATLTAAAPMARADNLLENSMIDLEYIPPDNPNYAVDYAIVQRLRVLDQLKAFLAPLRLPRKLKVVTTQCGMTNAFYEPYQSRLVICYEWVSWIRRIAPLYTSDDGITRDTAIVGAFVQVTLHELGHAVIHMLKVPVFGREEDAADQIAAFLMLQFGRENAKRTLSGAAYFWGALIEQSSFTTQTAFSDVHGTEAQRFYNHLCIAYGGDPEDFQIYVDRGILPAYRARQCSAEYNQIYYAFSQTIAKHIDFQLAREVQSREWLPPPPN
ncbi:MAG: DUF4344 domain-containing metallopeptidase [Alsobacter sp.]